MSEPGSTARQPTINYLLLPYALRGAALIAVCILVVWWVAIGTRTDERLTVARAYLDAAVTLYRDSGYRTAVIPALLESLATHGEAAWFDAAAAPTHSVPAPPSADVRSVVGAAWEDPSGQAFLRLRSDTIAVARVIRNDTGDAVGTVALLMSAESVQRGSRQLEWTLMGTAAVLVIGGLLLARGAIRTVTDPLKELRLAADRFARGELFERAAIAEPVEFAELAENLNRIAKSFAVQITALNAQRYEAEAVLSAMVEGVIVVNADRSIRSMNRAALDLFRVGSDPVGAPLLSAIDLKELDAVIHAVGTDRRTVERTIAIPEEQPRYIQVHGVPLETGPDGSTLLVCHDVTRIHRLEQVRREFVANVSHELITPITSISGFVETLLGGAMANPDDARRFLSIVAAQSERLSAIIQDLLHLSRLEQGDAQIAVRRSPIAPILHGVRAALERKAAAKETTVVVHCAPDLIAVVNASLIEQAVGNLVDNAIKYTHNGATVEIAAEQADTETLSLIVSDNGPGIPEAHIDRVFERFYRIDRARSRDMGGTGLGLAIVKHIARAHGGTVNVTSRVGSGTRFTITVPARAARPSLQPSEPVEESPQDLRGPDQGAE